MNHRENSLKKLFWPSLLIRVAAAIGVGFVFSFYYGHGDTFPLFYASADLVQEAESAGHFLQMMISAPEGDPYYTGAVRDFNFLKFLQVLYWLSLGNYYIAAVLLGLLSFFSSWKLVKLLAAGFEDLPLWVFTIPLLFWPSFVFWTSGILKETFLWIFICWSLFFFFKFLRTRNILHLLLMLLFLACIYSFKYYFVLLSAPFLVMWMICHWLPWKNRSRLYLVTLAFSVMVVLFFFSGIFDYFLAILYGSYEAMQAKNASANYILQGFEETRKAFVRLLPEALFSALYRPLPFESPSVWGVLASLENVLLLVGSLFALGWALVKRKIGWRAVLILFYVLSCAALLGFSAPNTGTISRYRIIFLPFYIMLLLIPLIQAHAKIKRPEKALN